MTSQITANGLSVDTLSAITQNLVTGMQGIYGSDINVDQNSPDGQMIGIFAQAVSDMLEFLVSINNSFDPDQAVGALLDQRVAINKIQRIGGTYTVQPISVTVNATVTLQGLDGNYNSPTGTGYMVQDSSGNQFILAATTTLTAGTTSLNFRAADIGAVSVPINTITTPVTIVQGVTAVNNPNGATTVGQNQETDAQLRTRRAQAVANATTGYLNGLLANVQALAGVTEAVLYENDTGSTDGNGTPAHTAWLVVAGGAAADIANAIYKAKSYGCGLRGNQTYAITTASGGTFTAKWDNPTAETLYIKFTIQTIPAGSGFSFNTTAIKNSMAAALVYGIGAAAETSAITTAAIAAIAAQGGGGVPVLVQISSDNITYTDYLTPTGINYQWSVSAANITITVSP